MRTDALTALLLNPFLTFAEAAKECGATGRREGTGPGPARRAAKGEGGRTREANAPRRPAFRSGAKAFAEPGPVG